MKQRTLKNYGVTGIEVTLNIADQMQVNHAIDRIDAIRQEFEETGEYDRESVLVDLHMFRNFFKKLAVEEVCMPTIFDEEKENKEAE